MGQGWKNRNCHFAFLAVAAVGCSANGGPELAQSWKTDAGTPATPDVVVTTPAATIACRAAKAGEDLSARIDVIVGTSLPGSAAPPQEIKTSALFESFKTECGTCHVSAGNGGRQTSESSFSTVVDRTWLASIITDNLTDNRAPKVMPPNGIPFSMRPPGHPLRKLAARLQAWIEQGRPTDSFTFDDPEAKATSQTNGLGYVYSSLTNLGDCVPDKTTYAKSVSSEMVSKDQLFATATALPRNLSDTDLTTFDGDTLALNGVVAYVPTYPLWSDGSGKLRHVRVPKGTSIKFDKATQTFEIPANTRFYKTFFRRVIDGAGRPSHRKIETRLIVSRPDTVGDDGVTPVQHALFGTYIWDESDEMKATLHEATYRDGTPFADKMIEYITDEVEYRDVISEIGAGAAATYPDRKNGALKAHPDLVRHYAVPGRVRCVQCHQGSPTKDFILGMNPLQVAQRSYPSGGTYEPNGADEINQLQRLIDYGLITGMTSPADVVPLERSQEPRMARNDHELLAQGYMLGNCAHCHNPRGYPSILKNELSKPLNMMPGPNGGIFEFSFDIMSPVRFRGSNGDVPMPYITPSLRDYPVAGLDGFRMDNGAYLVETRGAETLEVTWTPKYSPDLERADAADRTGCQQAVAIPAIATFCRGRTSGPSFVAAPWRSLLYRNVDTPFSYFDDYVPFPHMPMNSAGFDCRAPRIIGTWMVSLPGVRKNLRCSEDALPKAGEAEVSNRGDGSYDDSPQPYREVKKGEPGYADALKRAEVRLEEYQSGIRYNYCQDILGADILDPVGVTVGSASSTYLPASDRYQFSGTPPKDPNNPQWFAQPAIGVPYHSHWFNFDPTEPEGEWRPRRAAEWEDILVNGKEDSSIPGGQTTLSDGEIASRKLVSEALEQVELTDELALYAKTPVPYGIWQEKPECRERLDKFPKVKDFQSKESSPDWIKQTNSSPESAVFVSSPGAMLYQHICINCHGPKANGQGLQVDLLAASSNGDARPASFIDGILGPLNSPGANLLRIFGGPMRDEKTAMTLGSRYMAWMALGGTLQRIPPDVIHLVEATKILGQSRPSLNDFRGLATASANMLNVAKDFCSIVLPVQEFPFRAKDLEGFKILHYPPFNASTPFIKSNYDWEMWMNLCTRFSPAIIRVYGVKKDTTKLTSWDGYLKALYFADESSNGFSPYPENTPVLDQNRVQQPYHRQSSPNAGTNNYYPACLDRSADAPVETLAEYPEKLEEFQRISNFPYCPPEFISRGKPMWQQDSRKSTEAQNGEIRSMKRWAIQGAAAAGMAVFSYLQSGTFDHQNPKPYFNQCQLLPP